MKTVLTIAGSDCSGGAGIQADIKTISACGLYAMSVITALTAQNTLRVTGIQEVSPEFLANQLDAVFTDIHPDAIKIGMLSSAALIDVIAQKLCQYSAKHIVLDPVMVSTSGRTFMHQEAFSALKTKLMPLAEVITPNLAEAEVLSGKKISSEHDLIQAAKEIQQFFEGAVLVKGGHSPGNANDLLYYEGKQIWFCEKRVNNTNTHGTGCTLSSAIACGLAQGFSLKQSVAKAKHYLTGALRYGLELGHGSGPLYHGYYQNGFLK